MSTLADETSRFLAAWMQVRQMVQAANFNRFQRAGLSATQFMTLNVLPSEGMTLSELARRLNLSPATLNKTVNSLEDRGLLRRTRSSTDARKQVLSTTEAGQEMQNAASTDFHAFMAGLFARMTPTGREGLLTGLERLVELNEQDHATATASADVAEDTVAETTTDAEAQARRSAHRAARR